MMEYWNAVVEFDHTYTGDDTDEGIIEAFAEWHVAVGRSASGRIEAVLSIPSENLKQASLTALSLLSQSSGLPDAVGLNVLRSDEYDKINGLAPVPPLVSVTEAAIILGVTRQRVLQMIHDERLHGIKVGNGWALLRTEIDNRAPAKHNESV